MQLQCDEKEVKRAKYSKLIIYIAGSLRICLKRVILVFISITVLFNNMRTLKFKAQPTNVFFATVNLCWAI